MKNLKNKKGFTLVELLAVIVVLAIVMGLAVVAITGVLDNARKATFVTDAKQFLEGARNIVTSADLNAQLSSGSNASHLITCDEGKNETDIYLNEISLQQGGDKSPYGNKYKKDVSYIHVVAEKENDLCQYTYSIYLTDGVYAIGTSENPKEWNSIEASMVQINNSSNAG